MKKHHKIKLIAASVALAVSFGASAGLGGLNVQSHLGEPFSGSITVTGDEAQALFNGGKATVSNGNLRTSVQRTGDRAVIHIRSSRAIKDPVLIFQVSAGSQSREYTAIIDPAGYSSKSDNASRARQEQSAPPADQQAVREQAARERINRAIRGNAGADASDGVRKENSKKAKNAQTPSKQHPATNTARPAEGIALSGKRHLVKQGETLIEIATRLRPQGMTVEQAIQALVRANPDVFVNKDADRMLAGKVLNIPAQLNTKAAASKPSADRHVEKPAVAAKPQPQTAAEPKTSSENREAPKPETPKADKAADSKAGAEAKPDTGAEAKVENPVQQSASAPNATEAGQAASAAAASSVAEEVLQPGISEEVPASGAAKSESESQIEEALAAQKDADAQDGTETSSEDGGLWRWLLIGGGALLVLLLLFKALGKRKTDDETVPVVPVAPAEEEDDDDDISFAENTLEARVRPEKFAPVQASHMEEPDGLSVEDDFDDEVFFPAPDTVKEAAEDEVSFNIDEIDDKHVGIVSGAVTVDEETEKRRDLDWDTVESTESVYEPEPENPYQPVSVVMEERGQDEVAAEAEIPTVAEVREFDEARPDFAPAFDTHGGLDEESQKSEAQIGQEEHSYTRPVAEERADLEFSYEAPETATVAESAETPAVAEEGGDADEGWDFFTEETETRAVEPLPEPAEREQTSSESSFEPDAGAEEPLGFVSTGNEIQDELPSDGQPFEIKRDEGISFQEGEEDFGLSTAQIGEVNETIEWENLAVDEEVGSSALDSGFISESVGMTAPLEAKYELAKMYVEIGDPDAARETLQELMEEAEGDILDKTKALLSELGS